MDCRIHWNSLSLEEWNKRFSSIRRTPLLQSYEYAKAVYPGKGQRGKWGLINIDGKEEGLVQIAEASTLCGFIHALILDMGPLWFCSNNIEEKSNVFFKELNHQFPARFGRKRRIIPLLQKSDKSQIFMTNNGFFFAKTSPAYETIWLDITGKEDTLRAHLKQKWRHQLNRAYRKNLSFLVDLKGHTLPEFLFNYQADTHQKRYRNITPKDVPAFYEVFTKTKKALLCHAIHKEKIVASALIFYHGCSATYQIGHVSETGRELSANYFLLWEAIKRMKEDDIKDFDLGGINAYDAKGIQHFKEGLNGEKSCIEGIYF